MNIMMMLFLFLSLFASQLLFVTPFVIEKEQVENNEEAPSLEVNKSISVSPEPETTEAPLTNVDFPLEEAEQDDGPCRRVSIYASLTGLGGLSDEVSRT